MNFVEEMRWRGMIHQSTPGTEEQLEKEMTSGYIGFDPTADSLHIGSLVQIMILKHFQRCGHKPIALVGGATGMVGDPSGKSKERNLLNPETLQHNLDCVQKQLEQFLDFDCGDNSAEVVNNYDWFKEFSFLDFIRDVGKHLTVNYMMAKDSVKKRISGDDREGMSFTEFTYQLVQGYDYYWLNQNKNCKIQMGGSDQFGNITTGTELIRRMGGGDAFALTTPLLTKADGSKFGKTESGNVWLDREKTSPYEFYQYWINSRDDDVKKYIRIFSLKNREEVEALEAQHDQDPGRRVLQNALADELTIRVHSEEDLNIVKEASAKLFDRSLSFAELVAQIPEQILLDNFKGNTAAVEKAALAEGVGIIDFLSVTTGFLSSKGEARRELKANSISVNKEKVNDELIVTADHAVNGKYMLVQRGKKKVSLIVLN